MLVLHYNVIWLIGSHMTPYLWVLDILWLFDSLGLMIIMSDDVWLSHLTQIMSPGFHVTDLFEHLTWFMSFDWLKNIAQSTHESQIMDFTLWLTMSNRGCMTWGDKSPGLGLLEDTHIRGLVPTKR